MWVELVPPKDEVLLLLLVRVQVVQPPVRVHRDGDVCRVCVPNGVCGKAVAQREMTVSGTVRTGVD